MNGFPKNVVPEETLPSAAKAAALAGAIAGLKPCAAQRLQQPNATSNSRSPSAGSGQALPLVGMTNLFSTSTTMLGHIGGSGRQTLRRSWRECGAAEIAEAAFVLPLLFVFVLGIFQFGRMYLVYSTIQRAAMEGARAAAGSRCATCGTGPLTAAQVATNVVGPILRNAHVDQTLLTVPATPRGTRVLALPWPVMHRERARHRRFACRGMWC